MIKASFLQKLFSYLVPVKIWQGSGRDNTLLELLLFRNQWQLATGNALYSDGYRYRPLALAFRKLKKELPQIKTMLVLGAGIGSAVHVMHKLGHFPSTTLVDYDEVIIGLAEDTMNLESMHPQLRFIHDDAYHFLQHTEEWSLIVVDIFQGRNVPDFVLEVPFLKACKEHLDKNGNLVLNYILNAETDFLKLKTNLAALFSSVEIMEHGINRIFFAKA